MCPGVRFGAHVSGRTGHSALTVNDCDRLRAVALIAVILAAVALARGAAVVEDTGTDPAQPLSCSRR